MNHETFIRNHLELHLIKGRSRARTLQRSIINETMIKFRQNDYCEIDELIERAIYTVKQYGFIGRGTTARRFSEATDVSITTGRRTLNSLSRIRCNKNKKPFIFTVDKK